MLPVDPLAGHLVKVTDPACVRRVHEHLPELAGTAVGMSREQSGEPQASEAGTDRAPDLSTIRTRACSARSPSFALSVVPPARANRPAAEPFCPEPRHARLLSAHRCATPSSSVPERFMKQPRRSGTRTDRSRLVRVLVGTAAILGTTAVLVRARARRTERRHPPVGRFITADRVRLHYYERGQGRPIVLLHGNGGTLDELLSSGLVDHLAQNHRVIAFDRPGFGYSERPRSRLWTPAAQARLIRDALDRLGVKEALVYGHSLGTQVAVSLALDAPELVRGLVLASGYYYPTVRADVPVASVPAKIGRASCRERV